MDQLKRLLIDGQWYEHVYMISIIVTALCFICFLFILAPYLRISGLIQNEYRRLSAGHFFISFRKAKQRELLNRAKLSVASRTNQYIFYSLGTFFSVISAISFGVAFWFFLGGAVYEGFFINNGDPVTHSVVPEDQDDDETEEIIDENDDNVHHVDSHWVDGYERSDGTDVEGYWRGGEDGYERSNPDGDPSNNLDSDYDSGGGDYNYDAEDDGYDGLGAELGEFLFGN